MFTLKNHHLRIIIIDVVIIIKTTSTSDTEGCNACLLTYVQLRGVKEALQSCALYVICAYVTNKGKGSVTHTDITKPTSVVAAYDEYMRDIKATGRAMHFKNIFFPLSVPSCMMVHICVFDLKKNSFHKLILMPLSMACTCLYFYPPYSQVLLRVGEKGTEKNFFSQIFCLLMHKSYVIIINLIFFCFLPR